MESVKVKHLRASELYKKRKDARNADLLRNINDLDFVTIIDEMDNVSNLKSLISEEKIYEVLMLCRVKEWHVIAAMSCSSANAKNILANGTIPEKFRKRICVWIKVMYLTAYSEIKAKGKLGLKEDDLLAMKYAFASFPYANKNVLTILYNKYLTNDIVEDKHAYMRKLFSKWRSLYAKEVL
jgi:hypothetical protein